MLPFQDKLYLISRRWNHHSSHSGYDILGKHLGTVLASKPLSSLILHDRMLYKLTKEMIAYDRVGVALELATLRHMAFHKECVYHFLYGESTYNLIGRFNGWRGHRIVATYHKPPKYFEEMVQSMTPVKNLSSVIIVGRNQYDSFNTILSPNRIHFLPHPVDTTYFTPPEHFGNRHEHLCLFVGAHLRDYRTLRAVIENAWVASPATKFVLVAYPSMRKEFEGLIGNYEVVSNISEEELLQLYRTASLLVMPLLETTANNTVLEALSSGLPIVVTDIGAINDYSNEDSVVYVPPYDAESMLSAILALLGSRKKRKEMSDSAREFAAQFDWKVIVEQYESVYSQVLENN